MRFALVVGAALAVGALCGYLYRGEGGGADSVGGFKSTPRSTLSAAIRAAIAKAPAAERRVLVTGAAGFVGFHTALQLHKEGDVVFGLDTFNHYYDVRLKHKRAALLEHAGMGTLFEGNVCDAELLKSILREGRVTHVIHLAAQAGVRYSLKKPLEYVEANVQCFVTLLEAVHAVSGNSVPIAYASSSSVYGLNTVRAANAPTPPRHVRPPWCHRHAPPRAGDPIQREARGRQAGLALRRHQEV